MSPEETQKIYSTNKEAVKQWRKRKRMVSSVKNVITTPPLAAHKLRHNFLMGQNVDRCRNLTGKIYIDGIDGTIHDLHVSIYCFLNITIHCDTVQFVLVGFGP